MKQLFIAAKYVFAGATAAAVLYFFVGSGVFLKEQEVSFGVTFSTLMARQLELEPRRVFDEILDDLGARAIRLPIYWNEVETERGKFDFSDYDYLVKKSEEAGAKLVLAVGRKLPRWPECHIPSWTEEIRNPRLRPTATDGQAKSEIRNDEFENSVDKYIMEVINRYKDSPAVIAWQIENEHFHVFGADCAAGKLKPESVDNEIALVRSLDSRPIMLTDAGKAGTWFTSLWKNRADIVGITMYYQVWNSRGAWNSTFGPGLFWLKKKIVAPFFPGKTIINAELQAEPFGPTLLPGYDLSLQKELMNVERLQRTIKRSRRAGFEENYLWGAEWWYWLKEKHNDPSMWEEAKELFIK